MGIDGFRVGSVFGFEIRIDVSWFVILVLILWSFSWGVFPAQYPDQPRAVYLAMGFAGALLFFASLLTHELSHSLVARTKGIPVEGITLFIFGGIAHTRMEAENPGDEFVIAGVGPLASLVIGLFFGAIWWVATSLGVTPAVTIVARYLAFLNVALAVFNLMPGFPLDGGRLFRSIVWRITGDLTKATRWATNGGKTFGLVLIALGALQLFAGAGIGGLWLIFIGWFLRNAAVMSMRQHVVRAMLEGVSAGDLMSADPAVVSPTLSLSDLVDSYFLTERHQAFPVVDGARPVGLITLQHVKAIPRDAWPSRQVGEAMRAVDELAVGAREPVTTALERMQDAKERRILVVDDGRLVGILSASDVAAWVQRSQE
ncbi:MAG: site-2 protease family protein, partial [Gemmatimonadota bacterium]